MAQHSVPVLLIPTAVGTVVVPSAAVCEVLPEVKLEPIPAAREWVLGYCIWRNTPVTVISFERLSADDIASIPIGRIVVMYPLPGRANHEYFAIAASHDPRSGFVESDTTSQPVPAQVGQRYIASATEINGVVGLIPDFEALKAAFYD